MSTHQTDRGFLFFFLFALFLLSYQHFRTLLFHTKFRGISPFQKQQLLSLQCGCLTGVQSRVLDKSSFLNGHKSGMNFDLFWSRIGDTLLTNYNNVVHLELSGWPNLNWVLGWPLRLLHTKKQHSNDSFCLLRLHTVVWPKNWSAIHN